MHPFRVKTTPTADSTYALGGELRSSLLGLKHLKYLDLVATTRR